MHTHCGIASEKSQMSNSVTLSFQRQPVSYTYFTISLLQITTTMRIEPANK